MPRGSHDTVDFYGLSLDVISRLDGGLVVNVEHRTDNLETRLALEHFRREDVILIGGSGFGGTAALLAQAFGPQRIVAYEANPRLAILSRQQIRVRDVRLDIRHGALSNRNGSQVFYVSESWPTSSLDSEFAANPRTEIVVPLLETRRLLDEHGITALLLDVERAELDILPSLDFERLRAVVVEIHAELRVAGALIRMMQQAGLRLRHHDQSRPDLHVVAAVRG